MKQKTTSEDYRIGAAGHLSRLSEEDIQLMDAYISGDSECRILIPDMSGRVIDIIQGPPSYEHVLQTYEAMNEHLMQLGSFVKVGEISRKDFDRLVFRRNILVKLFNAKLERDGIA